MTPIEVPDEADILVPRLAKNWNININLSRQTGDSFARDNKYLLMKVPSALISDAFNYLINPGHPMITRVKPLSERNILFDKRLMEIMRLKR